MTAVTRKILTTAAVVAAAAALVAVPLTAAQADDTPARVVTEQGALSDLVPAAAGPLDGARAVVVMVSDDGDSAVRLHVYGIDRSVAGRTFGAHLHVGPCVAGNGAAAGPHYNTDTLAGQVPPRVDETTEVWLDFTATEGGTGHAAAEVPFVPVPGNRSIVIHQEPTDPNGAAGPRLACLPLSW
ncbi:MULTISPECIES: superoxide dismutase family protein [unclassified Kribbella]|uniref:superoxide dismutase family protein n=1 Tax=unclassified Kribbella TaxID=2644121 RepID=UPI00301602EE